MSNSIFRRPESAFLNNESCSSVETQPFMEQPPQDPPRTVACGFADDEPPKHGPLQDGNRSDPGTTMAGILHETRQSNVLALFEKAVVASGFRHSGQRTTNRRLAILSSEIKTKNLNRATQLSLGEIELRFSRKPLLASFRCDFGNGKLKMLHLPWSKVEEDVISATLDGQLKHLGSTLRELGLFVDCFYQENLDQNVDAFLKCLRSIHGVPIEFYFRCRKLLYSYALQNQPSLPALKLDIDRIGKKIIKIVGPFLDR